MSFCTYVHAHQVNEAVGAESLSMGTLSFLNHKFYFQITTDPKNARSERVLAEKAGLRFDSDTLRWVTRDFRKARVLRRYADGSAERKLKNHFITEFAPPEHIIYPDELDPKWWQIESVWHAVTRSPAYVADEPGLGKTATAIMAINTVPGKALVICPPYLKYTWWDELGLWGVSPPAKLFLGTGTIIDSKSALCDFEQDILILPDTLLTNKEIQQKLLAVSPFKWIIGDEFHRFNNPEAQRSQTFIGDKDGDFSIASLGERLLSLSGTPIPNGKPIEIYSPLSKLAPEAIGHRDALEFGKTFCAAKRITRYEGGRAIANWDFSGASHLKLLRKGLREKLMIRHLKKDCLKELGPKTRRLIFLDAPKEIRKLDRELLKNRSIEELLGKKASLGDIAHYRKKVGLLKTEPSLEYIKAVLESGTGKLLIAANHIEVVETLWKELKPYGALIIRGGMTAQRRNEAVGKFRFRKKYRVLVGNTISMGLGLTLTSAWRGIMVEPEWTPGTNEQVEDRIHRIGQDENVLWDYLVLRDSLDERVLRRALEKEDNIRTIMN